MPQLWYRFSAFIADERHILLFVCRYDEPFRSYSLPIDGGSAKYQAFPRQIFRGGVKELSKVGFKDLTPRQTCVQISWRSVKGA